tara:strand:+ start:2332 stop:2523 length:192 start_codon:yes stop_codon:yes gene_type:complete
MLALLGLFREGKERDAERDETRLDELDARVGLAVEQPAHEHHRDDLGALRERLQREGDVAQRL